MDLQTNGGNPVTSDNAKPPSNSRAYSPQIAGYNRLQPDTPSEQFAFTTSHLNVEPDASDPGLMLRSCVSQLDQPPDRRFASCDIIAECAGMTHGLSDATRIPRAVQRPVVVPV